MLIDLRGSSDCERCVNTHTLYLQEHQPPLAGPILYNDSLLSDKLIHQTSVTHQRGRRAPSDFLPAAHTTRSSF